MMAVIGLLAHFYHSAAAYNLPYERKVGPLRIVPA